MAKGFATSTDQKRLVRGEHWLMTRTLLRGRDFVHHAKWQVLMIAGPNPHEEIDCIRELMPKAVIVAVDSSPENVERAKIADADFVACLDLEDYQTSSDRYVTISHPPAFFDSLPNADAGKKTSRSGRWGDAKRRKFDAICLDLTGPATRELKKQISIYSQLLAPRGVMIVTFCYGRDVTEAYELRYEENDVLGATVPDPIKYRLWWLLGGNGIKQARSVMQYRGQQMPMVSVLLQRSSSYGPGRPLKFVKVTDQDFEAAVTENWSRIYACPQDRIAHIRRKMAARKAVVTRQAKPAEKPADYSAELPLFAQTSKAP